MQLPCTRYPGSSVKIKPHSFIHPANLNCLANHLRIEGFWVFFNIIKNPCLTSTTQSNLLPCPWANLSSGGALEPSLTSDLFEEGRRPEKEILPVGINKVSHYHLKAADCISVKSTFRPAGIQPPSSVSVGTKSAHQTSNDKNQSGVPWTSRSASYLTNCSCGLFLYNQHTFSHH